MNNYHGMNGHSIRDEIRRARLLIFALAISGISFAFLAIAATPVHAATAFDGTYDFTWSGNVFNGYSWEYMTYTEPGFMIISNGEITNAYIDEYYNPSGMPPGSAPEGGVWWITFDGSVDSNGNAVWTGGSAIHTGNLAYTYTGVINSDGTGSGSYSYPSAEHGTWSIKKSGFSLFGSSSEIVTFGSIGLIIIAIVIISVVISTPLKVPLTPAMPQKVPPSNMNLEPSFVRETGMEPFPMPPQEGQSMGGIGLHEPPSYNAQGKPLPPRQWPQTDPPRCPIHGNVALVAHYFRTDGDPGSWFCPLCKGYPYGKN